VAANAALSSAELAERIIEQVHRFSEQGPVLDDRTLMVLKVK